MDISADALDIRQGTVEDAEEINFIYNWYVAHSTITFDISPWSLARRQSWIRDLLHPDNPYHLLVASLNNEVVGFSYNAVFRPKAAYDSATEVTIYTRQPASPRGTGTALYNQLFSALQSTTLHRAYAVISQPNPASVRFHKKFGFELIGTLNEVGSKFGNWIDVAWYEKKLGSE